MNSDISQKKEPEKIENPIREYREIKESIIRNLKEHNNVISKIYFDLTDKITNSVLLIIDCYRNGGKVILIGNGGSAADAQHIAAEFIGHFKLERASLPAISLTTNTSILTALANDYGYETIFSRQLESLANSKDVLIAITTSGNSQNILKAVEMAKSKNIKTIGMTGKTGGKLKNMVDILVNIPSDDTPRIQESHIIIGHIICGIVEENLNNN